MRVVLVFTDIRRDLVAPLGCFRSLEVLLYYHTAYSDFAPGEMGDNLTRYRNAIGLFLRLWREKPDLVQGLEPFAIRLLPRTYAVLLATWMRRIPLYILSVENRPLDEKHGPFFAPLERLLLRPVFNRARAIIYVSEGVRRNVLSVGPYGDKLERLMYGTWGVDPEEFSPLRDGREPDLGAGPAVLFVGRLHVEKGIWVLLEAFGLVREQMPTARLVLVGQGSEQSAIEREVARRGWQEAVVLVGPVKNRDLPPYLRAAQVVVSPSLTTRKWEEQVGMVNIQAMACGVPVVSTQSGAIAEYVPDGQVGLLVPERDPRALAEGVLRLLGDEALRRRMGAAGRAHALEHYDARLNVAQAEEWLLGLLAQIRSARGA